MWLALIGVLALAPLLVWESRRSRPAQASSNVTLFEPASGHYDFPILLSLSSSGGQPFFTLDGSDPTVDGTAYDGPIALGQDGVVVVRAASLSAENGWSDQTAATYIIGLETSLPVLSIIANPDDIWSNETGIFANSGGRGPEWEREAYLMFFEGERSATPKQLAFVSPAGVRIHGSASRAYPKPSLRFYFRSEYGNARLNYPLYEGQSKVELTNFDRLLLHGGSQDYAAPDPIISNWTLLRTALFYELAAEVEAYTTQSRPMLLFVNGRSYGIFQLRMLVDETFLLDRYGIDAEILSISGDLGSDNALFVPNANLDSPLKQAWLGVLNFVETNDLNDPAVYAQLEQQVDLDNFIDYVILQMYAGNTDWLRNNVKQFRDKSSGQWSWVLWDLDYAFGLAPWSNVETDMLDWLYTTERPGFEQGSLLLRRLLETERFQQRYLVRLDELLDGVLSAETVLPQLDQMADELRPDITYETDVWTSSGDWEASVEEMRDFVVRRPAILRQHHEQMFGPLR